MPAPTVNVKTSFLQTIDIGLRGLLYNKFGDIFDLESVNKGVVLFPKEVALREMAEKRGQTELEFINVWRTQTAPDWARMRTPAARRGMLLEFVDANTKTDIAYAKAVPVHLEYNVWFWTKYVERLNLIGERYLFWQQIDPNMDLNFDVTYDTVEHTYPVKLHLHFGPLTDESTEAEKFDKGAMYILKTPITVDGDVFIADSVKTIKTITLTFYDKDDLETEADYSEIIVDDSNHNAELELALRLFTKTIDENT